MNRPILALITLYLLLITPIFTTTLHINYPGSVLEKSMFWIRVKITVEGGSQPYNYFYSGLPFGWKQVNKYIYIPVIDAEIDSSYSCLFRVIDARQAKLEKRIYFITRNGRVFLKNDQISEDQAYPSQSEDNFGVIVEGENVKVATGKLVNPSRPKDLSSPNLSYETDIDQQQNSFLSHGETPSSDTNFQFSFDSGTTSIDSFTTKNIKSEEDRSILSTTEKTVKKAEKQAYENTIQRKKRLSQLAVTEDTSDEAVLTSIKNIVTTANTQIKTSTRSIDQIFRRLPTLNELDDIILNVDILSISKTIQQVIVSDMTCDQKISYLSEFFGRIQANVELKKLSLTKLKLIEELASEQIERLIRESDRLKSEKEKVSAYTLTNSLHQQVLKLQAAYDNYNKATADKSAAEKRLPEYEKKAKSIRNSIQEHKNFEKKNRDKLQKTFDKIQRIKLELKAAEKQKDKYLQEIDKNQKIIIEFEMKLSRVLEEARQTSQLLTKSPQYLDSLKRKYLLLEVEVARIREDIKLTGKKQDKILEDVHRINNEIEEQEKKLNRREILNVEMMIESLERNLPKIQEQIDKLYYSCYEASLIVTKSINPKQAPSYLIEPQKYVTYLQLAYGLDSTEKVKQMIQDQKEGKVNLTQVTVFSSSWSETYGEVINQDTQNGQLLKNDFNCLRPSTLQTRSGVIKYIRKNLMIVLGDDGNIYKLHLGACSRIQSAGSQLPMVSQRAFFKGNQQQDLTFNVYTVSSY